MTLVNTQKKLLYFIAQHINDFVPQCEKTVQFISEISEYAFSCSLVCVLV